MVNLIHKIDDAEALTGRVLPTSHVLAPMPPVQPTRVPQDQAPQSNTSSRITRASDQAPASDARPAHR